MSEMTDWFPAHIKPVRVGVYETFDGTWPKPKKTGLYSYWDGYEWSRNGFNLFHAEGMQGLPSAWQKKQWRGFTKEQK